jgi:hypothetical protein
MWNVCYLQSPGQDFVTHYTDRNKFIIVNMVQLKISEYAQVQYMLLQWISNTTQHNTSQHNTTQHISTACNFKSSHPVM